MFPFPYIDSKPPTTEQTLVSSWKSTLIRSNMEKKQSHQKVIKLSFFAGSQITPPNRRKNIKFNMKNSFLMIPF
jgi:hypothetical protein